jgi:hypothetical protein
MTPISQFNVSKTTTCVFCHAAWIKQALERKQKTVQQEVQEDEPQTFNEVWRELRKAGWTHRNGKGLVAWLYLRPGVKGKLADLRLGEDYFDSEAAVLAFVEKEEETQME